MEAEMYAGLWQRFGIPATADPDVRFVRLLHVLALAEEVMTGGGEQG